MLAIVAASSLVKVTLAVILIFVTRLPHMRLYMQKRQTDKKNAQLNSLMDKCSGGIFIYSVDKDV